MRFNQRRRIFRGWRKEWEQSNPGLLDHRYRIAVPLRGDEGLCTSSEPYFDSHDLVLCPILSPYLNEFALLFTCCYLFLDIIYQKTDAVRTYYYVSLR